MYTTTNYKSKKAFKEAVKAGVRVTVFQPNQMVPVSMTGRVTLEGPHYPAPHTWYADVQIRDGVVTSIYG